MVEGVSGGEVFSAVGEDRVFIVIDLDFGWEEGGRGTVGVLEDDGGEFSAFAVGFDEWEVCKPFFYKELRLF